METIIERLGTQGEAFEAMTCPTAISKRRLVCSFPLTHHPGQCLRNKISKPNLGKEVIDPRLTTKKV
jgi:hypothetical protein